ncbi:MAG: radical SAM protein [Lentisphaeria bacterium]|nr:radical SAM protein [Lentisphaeria bacterium]
MIRKYVFGPIASRRLGVSLGVDLVPAKTCCQDCIYCEAKATTCHTIERKSWVNIHAVLAELDETLRSIPHPDFVTFSGAGEPTLNADIGKVIAFLKSRYPDCKVCLLTNGMLLGDRQVQQDVAGADMVIPSLDASNEAEYQAVNRPVSGESFEKLVAGLISFRQNSTMKIALEIFVAPGINDSAASIARFAGLAAKIAPDAIQLNTLDRPGVIKELRPAPPETMEKFRQALCRIAPVAVFGPR